MLDKLLLDDNDYRVTLGFAGLGSITVTAKQQGVKVKALPEEKDFLHNVFMQLESKGERIEPGNALMEKVLHDFASAVVNRATKKAPPPLNSDQSNIVEAELDGVVDMAQILSRDWAGYSKPEFLQKMPGTWHGATAEDQGAYVVIRNPELYKYFEFHFVFGEQQDASMDFLIVRGLDELKDLSILVQSGQLASTLRAASGNPVSRDAKKAAEVLDRKYGIRLIE